MKWLYVLLILLLIPTASALDDWDWCADQDVFFWNASSDISGYRILDHRPEIDSQRSITTPSFSSSSGEIVVGSWVTPVGSPGVSMLAPGQWRFRTYAYSSSTSGVTTLEFYAINRSSTGVETNLFFGNAITQDIDATGTPNEYLTSYARRNYTTMFPGDRLVIRVNASTTSSSARTLTYLLAGNTNASMVSVSYFICPDAVSGGIGNDAGVLVAGAAMVGLIVGLILIRRKQ
jgi:hypothetical protein